MNSCWFAVAPLFCLIKLSSGFSIQTRLAVGYEHGAPVEIDRYTDTEKGFTALKDKKYKSCFIKDYDPFWNPEEKDKLEMMKKIKYETIESDQEASRLRTKTGDIIANMCKPVKIFWATTPAPPPLQIIQTGSNDMAPPPIPSNRDHLPDAIPIVDTDKLPIEMQDRIQEQFGNPGIPEPPKISPEMIHEVEDIKTPPPLEIYRQNHPVNVAEIPPPIITDKEEAVLIPPPINTRKVEMPAPPPPMMLKPNPQSDMDEFKAPPPLEVWRRMLAYIKRTTTLEPPFPDMRTPKFRPGGVAPPIIDQPPPNMRVLPEINASSGHRHGDPEMIPPPRIEPHPENNVNKIEGPPPIN